MTERPPLPYSWREIRERLQGAQWQLYGRLGLKGPQSPGVFTPLNPTRNDRSPGSLVIYTEGGRRGGWVEYAEAGTPKGDIIGLVAYCLRLKGTLDAYWWACDFLNLDRKGNGAQPRTRAQAEEEKRASDLAREKSARDDVARQDAKAGAALIRWLKCRPLAGTVAETYLRQARAAPLDRLDELPGSLRFDPLAEHTDPDTGEVTEWPAMVAAMNAYGRKVRAIHRTFLAPDGSGKAPVNKPKMMWGPAKGCAIRLSKGRSKLSPEAAAADGVRGEVLAISEGIEDGLIAACAMPEWRVWAAGSVSTMQFLDWPPSVATVVLLRDNDWEKPALAAFAVAEAHWLQMAAGRPVRVFGSKVGKDLNDWARGEAA